MSDHKKSWQRNIRIHPDLWAYVQSIAPKGHTKNGDCSQVIAKIITQHRDRSAAYRRGWETRKARREYTEAINKALAELPIPDLSADMFGIR